MTEWEEVGSGKESCSWAEPGAPEGQAVEASGKQRPEVCWLGARVRPSRGADREGSHRLGMSPSDKGPGGKWCSGGG